MFGYLRSIVKDNAVLNSSNYSNVHRALRTLSANTHFIIHNTLKQYMLFLSIFTTLVSAIAGLALTNTRDPFFLKVISIFFSGLALFLSCILFIRFDPDSFYFQFHTTYSIGSESLNMLYSFGIDNMSVLFFLLSSLLVFCCTLFI